jgi:hypothetical protein
MSVGELRERLVEHSDVIGGLKARSDSMACALPATVSVGLYGDVTQF